MAALAIHLLGPPSIVAGGRSVAPPRGRKAWALLAYLLTDARPAPRERLAGLLFEDADDPLGALRWNLSEVRRLLGDPSALRGGAIALELPPGTFVDVRAVLSGTWLEAAALPGLGRDLLEGMDFPSSPSFEAWLTNERRHLQAASQAVLHEAALASLAAGDAGAAADHAARLVAGDPFDERSQELLIRAYAAAGDARSAARQLAACRALFRRELGRAPGEAVVAAARTPAPGATAVPAAAPAAVSDRAAALAQLEAGEAAVRAGAIDTGIGCLRRAAAQADGVDEPALQARAALALALARFDAGRDGPEVVAAGLHRALQAAERAGDGAVAARARLALAYVEELAGRYDRAERWLEEAAAGRPPGRLADEIAMAHARCRLDRGHYAEGRAPLRAVLAGACERGDRDLEMWSRIQLGRASLLQGEVDEAIELLRDAAADGRAAGLTAYVPLPLSLLGRALMQRGDHDAAREALEHGLALGTQVQDPCWQGLNLAGLGLLAAAEGDVGAAIAALEVARRLAVRGPVTSVWVLAHVSDALCAVAVEHDVPQARRWVADLETLTARTGMRDLLSRAHLYRHALGQSSALAAATLVAADVESPALERAIAARSPVAA